jgi:hypothetical protein
MLAKTVLLRPQLNLVDRAVGVEAAAPAVRAEVMEPPDPVVEDAGMGRAELASDVRDAPAIGSGTDAAEVGYGR